MGFSFRKSVKIGGARLNVGKKGVSVSTGVKGFRVSTGTNGTRLSTGAGGVRYTTKIGSSSRRKNSSSSGEMTAPEVLLVCIFLFIIGGVLAFIGFNIGLWIMAGSFVIGGISSIIIVSNETKKNEEILNNTFDSNNYRLSLEDEILKEIEKNGESGILQTELLERYYTSNPSKSTLYQTIKKLEIEIKIKKIKEGRTYRIYTI